MEEKNAILKIKYIEEILGKQIFNELISEHLDHMYRHTNIYRYRELAERMQKCGQSWFFGEYKKQATYDLQSINYCKSKFCPICQDAMQSSKVRKYLPVIEKKAKDYDIYHCILTKKSTDGKNLKESIGQILKAFPMLIGYFKQHTKIKGIDFSQYGYDSAFRSLEITYKGDSYHDHLHCMFAMKKGLELKQHIRNKFSISRHSPGEVYLFSDLEILIQKVWYLLINNIKVTKQSIDSLELGYSCQFKKIENNTYAEVFKYASQIFDENASLVDRKQFEILFKALDGRRLFQGYGAFVGIGKDEIDESFDIVYKNIINRLNSIENPKKISFQIEKLKNKVKYSSKTFICRKAIYSVWQDLQKEGIELEPDMINLEFIKEAPKDQYRHKKSEIKKTFREQADKEFNALLEMDYYKKQLNKIVSDGNKEKKEAEQARAQGEKASTNEEIKIETNKKNKKLYARIQRLIKSGLSNEFIKSELEAQASKESYKDKLKKIIFDQYKYAKRKVGNEEYKEQFKKVNNFYKENMSEEYIKKLLRINYRASRNTKDEIFSALNSACIKSSENLKNFMNVVEYHKRLNPIMYDAIAKDFNMIINSPYEPKDTEINIDEIF